MGLIAALCLTAVASGCTSAPRAGPPAGHPVAATLGPSAAQPTATAGPVTGGPAVADCPAAPYGPREYAPGSSKTVALTFDDGPGRSTPAILAILAQYQVTATFFNIGVAMAARPWLVQEEVEAGYAMGNHTWDHPNLVPLSAASQTAELTQASTEQQSIAGTLPCAFRPPYGKYDAAILKLAQQLRLGVWMWSVDTMDWMADGSGSSHWEQRIIQRAEQGGALMHPVLLMHDARPGNPATVAALPAIIQFFRSHGYSFVGLLAHVFRRSDQGRYAVFAAYWAVAATVMPMHDREVVAAIVAGDPEGIAEAYDRYAMPLYSYCRSLLREPEDAADAVQDTFLIATTKLGGLRDPGKLRSWLYAVARNECYRRLRSGEATSALDEARDMTTESADVAGAVEQAELRQLVRDAIGGLNPGERDVIELGLVQGLDGDELADALGVSRNHAHSLQSRARSQLERSLGALVVARTGREACPALDTVLARWDGQMTVLMRKRISRHIDQCQVCGERKRRELTPALFAGALPLPMISTALMPGFREHVLKTCADRSLEGLARRANVAARAGQFGAAGFPAPISPPGVSGWHQLMRHSHALVASAATAAAAAGVSAVLIIGGGAPQSHAPAAGARGSAGPGVVPNSRGAPSRGAGTSPRAGASGLAPGSAGATAPGVLGIAPGSHPPLGKSSTGNSSKSTTSAPGVQSPASSTSSAAAAPSSAPAAPGTLSVSLSRLVLVAVNGHGTGTFTLTAKGGPVSYSISAAANLTVSPASGSLAAGASVTITVTSSSLISLDEQLTISPGGYTVTVVLNISL